MDNARDILRNKFGLQNFRGKQEAVIERLVVQGKNALAVMPTGSGKSLCYQLPSLILPGLTLVISPLIALMKDQVDALVRKNVVAGRFDSTQSTEEYQQTVRSLRDGTMKILYVAPERLNMEGFMSLIRQFTIELLVVDESHCVSEWGDAFRPDYLKIARFAQENDVTRILCLTATATPTVAEDIARAFEIDIDEGIFRTPSYRPNLRLLIESIPDDPQGSERISRCIRIIKESPGPTIIYITTQSNTQNVANELKAKGIEAKCYHAGMDQTTRHATQEWFMESPRAVVCATIAFGMGIDKADIRNVIHFNLPKTLEGYSQEVGRAGRDGEASTCTLFLHTGDRSILENFARGNTPSNASVRAMIRHVCAQAKSQGADKEDADKYGVLEIDAWHLGRELDIRDVTLSLLFAQLELRSEFAYIRAITPAYAVYEYSENNMLYKNVEQDRSPVAETIKAHTRPARTKWYTVDVTHTVSSSDFSREDVVSKLNEWGDKGWITLKPSQRRNRYRILKAFPEDESEIVSIADCIFDEMLKRENAEVKRMEGVFEWAAAPQCLPKHLAHYFGDGALVLPGDETCGHCTVCANGGTAATTYEYTPPEFDETRFQRVLKLVRKRDDARFLTRVAFGITSPRVTAEKLSKHSDFGCMSDHKWDELLARSEEAVATWRAANPDGAAATAVPSTSEHSKRKSTSSGYGRGASVPKRARVSHTSSG